MTEHLPIQRWTKVFTRYPASEVLPSENGEYVTYADHLDALRACEERVRKSWYEVQSETWMQGFRYALDAAREAVAALVRYDHNNYALVCQPDGWAIDRDEALAAIDRLREEEK